MELEVWVKVFCSETQFGDKSGKLETRSLIVYISLSDGIDKQY